MQAEIGNKGIHANEEEFTVIKEEPNVYRLESGVTVRVRTSVVKIGRQVDSEGNLKVNRYGDPAVLVRYHVVIDTSEEGSSA